MDNKFLDTLHNCLLLIETYMCSSAAEQILNGCQSILSLAGIGAAGLIASELDVKTECLQQLIEIVKSIGRNFNVSSLSYDPFALPSDEYLPRLLPNRSQSSMTFAKQLFSNDEDESKKLDRDDTLVDYVSEGFLPVTQQSLVHCHMNSMDNNIDCQKHYSLRRCASDVTPLSNFSKKKQCHSTQSDSNAVYHEYVQIVKEICTNGTNDVGLMCKNLYYVDVGHDGSEDSDVGSLLTPERTISNASLTVNSEGTSLDSVVDFIPTTCDCGRVALFSVSSSYNCIKHASSMSSISMSSIFPCESVTTNNSFHSLSTLSSSSKCTVSDIDDSYSDEGIKSNVIFYTPFTTPYDSVQRLYGGGVDICSDSGVGCSSFCDYQSSSETNLIDAKKAAEKEDEAVNSSIQSNKIRRGSSMPTANTQLALVENFGAVDIEKSSKQMIHVKSQPILSKQTILKSEKRNHTKWHERHEVAIHTNNQEIASNSAAKADCQTEVKKSNIETGKDYTITDANSHDATRFHSNHKESKGRSIDKIKLNANASGNTVFQFNGDRNEGIITNDTRNSKTILCGNGSLTHQDESRSGKALMTKMIDINKSTGFDTCTQTTQAMKNNGQKQQLIVFDWTMEPFNLNQNASKMKEFTGELRPSDKDWREAKKVKLADANISPSRSKLGQQNVKEKTTTSEDIQESATDANKKFIELPIIKTKRTPVIAQYVVSEETLPYPFEIKPSSKTVIGEASKTTVNETVEKIEVPQELKKFNFGAIDTHDQSEFITKEENTLRPSEESIDLLKAQSHENIENLKGRKKIRRNKSKERKGMLTSEPIPGPNKLYSRLKQFKIKRFQKKVRKRKTKRNEHRKQWSETPEDLHPCCSCKLEKNQHTDSIPKKETRSKKKYKRTARVSSHSSTGKRSKKEKVHSSASSSDSLNTNSLDYDNSQMRKTCSESALHLKKPPSQLVQYNADHDRHKYQCKFCGCKNGSSRLPLSSSLKCDYLKRYKMYGSEKNLGISQCKRNFVGGRNAMNTPICNQMQSNKPSWMSRSANIPQKKASYCRSYRNNCFLCRREQYQYNTKTYAAKGNSILQKWPPTTCLTPWPMEDKYVTNQKYKPDRDDFSTNKSKRYHSKDRKERNSSQNSQKKRRHKSEHHRRSRHSKSKHRKSSVFSLFKSGSHKDVKKSRERSNSNRKNHQKGIICDLKCFCPQCCRPNVSTGSTSNIGRRSRSHGHSKYLQNQLDVTKHQQHQQQQQQQGNVICDPQCFCSNCGIPQRQPSFSKKQEIKPAGHTRSRKESSDSKKSHDSNKRSTSSHRRRRKHKKSKSINRLLSKCCKRKQKHRSKHRRRWSEELSDSTPSGQTAGRKRTRVDYDLVANKQQLPKPCGNLLPFPILPLVNADGCRCKCHTLFTNCHCNCHVAKLTVKNHPIQKDSKQSYRQKPASMKVPPILKSSPERKSHTSTKPGKKSQSRSKSRRKSQGDSRSRTKSQSSSKSRSKSRGDSRYRKKSRSKSKSCSERLSSIFGSICSRKKKKHKDRPRKHRTSRQKTPFQTIDLAIKCDKNAQCPYIGKSTSYKRMKYNANEKTPHSNNTLNVNKDPLVAKQDQMPKMIRRTKSDTTDKHVTPKHNVSQKHSIRLTTGVPKQCDYLKQARSFSHKGTNHRDEHTKEKQPPKVIRLDGGDSKWNDINKCDVRTTLRKVSYVDKNGTIHPNYRFLFDDGIDKVSSVTDKKCFKFAFQYENGEHSCQFDNNEKMHLQANDSLRVYSQAERQILMRTKCLNKPKLKQKLMVNTRLPTIQLKYDHEPMLKAQNISLNYNTVNTSPDKLYKDDIVNNDRTSERVYKMDMYSYIGSPPKWNIDNAAASKYYTRHKSMVKKTNHSEPSSHKKSGENVDQILNRTKTRKSTQISSSRKTSLLGKASESLYSSASKLDPLNSCYIYCKANCCPPEQLCHEMEINSQSDEVSIRRKKHTDFPETEPSNRSESHVKSVTFIQSSKNATNADLQSNQDNWVTEPLYDLDHAGKAPPSSLPFPDQCFSPLCGHAPGACRCSSSNKISMTQKSSTVSDTKHSSSGLNTKSIKKYQNETQTSAQNSSSASIGSKTTTSHSESNGGKLLSSSGTRNGKTSQISTNPVIFDTVDSRNNRSTLKSGQNSSSLHKHINMPKDSPALITTSRTYTESKPSFYAMPGYDHRDSASMEHFPSLRNEQYGYYKKISQQNVGSRTPLEGQSLKSHSSNAQPVEIHFSHNDHNIESKKLPLECTTSAYFSAQSLQPKLPNTGSHSDNTDKQVILSYSGSHSDDTHVNKHYTMLTKKSHSQQSRTGGDETDVEYDISLSVRNQHNTYGSRQSLPVGDQKENGNSYSTLIYTPSQLMGNSTSSTSKTITKSTPTSGTNDITDDYEEDLQDTNEAKRIPWQKNEHAKNNIADDNNYAIKKISNSLVQTITKSTPTSVNNDITEDYEEDIQDKDAVEEKIWLKNDHANNSMGEDDEYVTPKLSNSLAKKVTKSTPTSVNNDIADDYEEDIQNTDETNEILWLKDDHADNSMGAADDYTNEKLSNSLVRKSTKTTPTSENNDITEDYEDDIQDTDGVEEILWMENNHAENNMGDYNDHATEQISNSLAQKFSNDANRESEEMRFGISHNMRELEYSQKQYGEFSKSETTLHLNKNNNKAGGLRQDSLISFSSNDIIIAPDSSNMTPIDNILTQLSSLPSMKTDLDVRTPLDAAHSGFSSRHATSISDSLPYSKLAHKNLERDDYISRNLSQDSEEIMQDSDIDANNNSDNEHVQYVLRVKGGMDTRNPISYGCVGKSDFVHSQDACSSSSDDNMKNNSHIPRQRTQPKKESGSLERLPQERKKSSTGRSWISARLRSLISTKHRGQHKSRMASKSDTEKKGNKLKKQLHQACSRLSGHYNKYLEMSNQTDSSNAYCAEWLLKNENYFHKMKN